MILALQLVRSSLLLRGGMVVELFTASGPMLLYLVKLMAVLLPFFGPVLAHPLAFPSLLLEVRAILFLLLLYPLKLILFKVLVFHLCRLFVLPTVLALLSLLGARAWALSAAGAASRIYGCTLVAAALSMAWVSHFGPIPSPLAGTVAAARSSRASGTTSPRTRPCRASWLPS